MKNYVKSREVANRSLRNISWTVFGLGTIAILCSLCSADQVLLIVGVMMFAHSAGVLFLTKSN